MCYMDETECTELARLSGKSEDQIEVIGFEYDDDDGDQERWMKCESSILSFLCRWAKLEY